MAKVVNQKAILIGDNVVTAENARQYVAFLGAMFVPDFENDYLASGGGLAGDANEHGNIIESLEDFLGAPAVDANTCVISVETLVGILYQYNPDAVNQAINILRANNSGVSY